MEMSQYVAIWVLSRTAAIFFWDALNGSGGGGVATAVDEDTTMSAAMEGASWREARNQERLWLMLIKKNKM